MPSYKLIYFNARGRAEHARLIFAHAGQEYVDERIESEEWPKRKDEMPFGKLPVLMIDGKSLPQSLAITSYLARTFDLQGDSPLEAAKCDMIMQTMNEACDGIPFREKDEKKKAVMMKFYFKNNMCPVFAKIEKMFIEQNSSFLVGEKLTYVDLSLMTNMTTLDILSPGFSESFPNLKALSERVKKMEKIKAWIQKRPKTQF